MKYAASTLSSAQLSRWAHAVGLSPHPPRARRR